MLEQRDIDVALGMRREIRCVQFAWLIGVRARHGVTARGAFTCVAFSIKMREYEEARYDDADVQDWDEHRGHDDGVAVADVFLDSVQCLCVFVSDPGNVAERRTFRPTRSIDRQATSNSPLHSLPPCLVAARSLSSAIPPPMSGSVAGRLPRYVLYYFHVLTFWSNTTLDSLLGKHFRK